MVDIPGWINLAIAVIAGLGGLAGLAALITSLSNAKVAARKSDLDILIAVSNELQDENKRLRERAEAAEAAIIALQESDREKQHLINSLQVRIRELEAQNRALKQENAELRAFYEKQNGGHPTG